MSFPEGHQKNQEPRAWPNYHIVARVALGLNWEQARPLIHGLAPGLRYTEFSRDDPKDSRSIFRQGNAGGMHPADIPELQKRYENIGLSDGL